MAYKGRFIPKNPTKYKGNPTQIIYRSLWELGIMRKFDENINIIEWSSEEIVIPYFSPIDKAWHRYFPDFWVKMQDVTGQIKIKIIEIKPASQSRPPEVKARGSKPTKRYITEIIAWEINNSKWKAAAEYCTDRKWEFVVLTEKDLGIKW